MPVLEITGLKQKAVLWTFAGHDKRGNPTVNTPVQIKVRWEKRVAELVDREDGMVAVNASIMVDREIAVGSLLRRGTLDDLPEPEAMNGVVEVVDYDEVPDIKGRRFQRTVQVRRYELPIVYPGGDVGLATEEGDVLVTESPEETEPGLATEDGHPLATEGSEDVGLAAESGETLVTEAIEPSLETESGEDLITEGVDGVEPGLETESGEDIVTEGP